VRRILVFAGTGALLAALFYFRAGTHDRTSQAPMPEEALAVDTEQVRVQPMPVSLEASGQVIAEHVVQVRPQVSGMLKKVFITEGQRVAVGQRLFLIEPAPFEAAVAAAKAAWESADGKLQRAVPLAKQGYVSSQDLITARAAADQALATYKQAMINLEYADIRAPLAGRTGILGLKSGNVVAPSDAAPLVTINETRPIQVEFNIPQQSLQAVREHQATHSLKISVSTENDSRILDEGALIFVDNAVNLRTGTILLKARTPNIQEQLWPGQYVAIHMQLAMEPRAIVVPQTAVQTGQNGNFVYVLAEGEAQLRSVKIDREVGSLAVISDGLKGDEQVVSRVPRGLRPGIRVVANSLDSKQ
jgi:multidrug efflux system membrane fusion protein